MNVLLPASPGFVALTLDLDTGEELPRDVVIAWALDEEGIEVDEVLTVGIGSPDAVLLPTGAVRSFHLSTAGNMYESIEAWKAARRDELQRNRAGRQS